MHRLLSRLVLLGGKFTRQPGIVTGTMRQSSFEPQKMVLCFWDTELVHLGDQLFHCQLIEAYRNHFDIHVVCPRVMVSFFKSLNVKAYPVSELKPLDFESALLISKNDMLFSVYQMFPKNNHFIGIDYGKTQSKERISNTIVSVVTQYLRELNWLNDVSESAHSISFVSSLVKLNEELKPNAFLTELAQLNQSYYVYNPYVASNHLSARKRKGKLLEMANDLKQKGFGIILAGSQNDLSSDLQTYEIADLDARGKLTALELFNLFSMPQVLGLISFDTYIAHVATLCHKDLHIVMKSDKNLDFYREKFIPMLPGREEILKQCL